MKSIQIQGYTFLFFLSFVLSADFMKHDIIKETQKIEKEPTTKP